jgi:hypothetical protein
MQSIAIEVQGDDVEFLETSFPLAVETTHKEKVIDQVQPPTLYQS